MTTTTTEAPRVYVACLAAYNGGRLHGAWIDLDDADDAHEQALQMLDTSPEPGAEEWAIHDHEGFGSYPVGEHESITELCDLAEAIEEHGAIVAEYAAHVGGDIPTAARIFGRNRAP